jgi:hypothetical protein
LNKTPKPSNTKASQAPSNGLSINTTTCVDENLDLDWAIKVILSAVKKMPNPIMEVKDAIGILEENGY